MPTLVSIADAPWSLRARRALDEAGVAERTGPEGPLLSEPSPRWRLGRWLHPVTVSVLSRETGPPLTDSVDVACRARPQGAAHPPPDPAAVLGWSERDHRALAADPRRPPPPGVTMHALCTHTLRAADLAAAARWYARLTGVDPYFEEPFYVGFSLGGYELGIRPAKPGQPVETGGATAYWGVPDADTALARAVELGATELEPVMDVGGGIRLGAVRDPFGNALGLITNPVFAVPSAGATVVVDSPAQLAAPDGALAPAELHLAEHVPRARDACFADWSDSARMTAWLGVPTRVEARIGGPYELHFLSDAPPGLRGSDHCRVLSLLPGRMLSFTWNAPPTQPATRLRHTWVVLQFTALDDGHTRVDLHHTGWPADGFDARGAPLPGSPWAETFAYFAAAWPRMLAGYAAHCHR